MSNILRFFLGFVVFIGFFIVFKHPTALAVSAGFTNICEGVYESTTPAVWLQSIEVSGNDSEGYCYVMADPDNKMSYCHNYTGDNIQKCLCTYQRTTQCSSLCSATALPNFYSFTSNPYANPGCGSTVQIDVGNPASSFLTYYFGDCSVPPTTGYEATLTGPALAYYDPVAGVGCPTNYTVKAQGFPDSWKMPTQVDVFSKISTGSYSKFETFDATLNNSCSSGINHAFTWTPPSVGTFTLAVDGKFKCDGAQDCAAVPVYVTIPECTASNNDVCTWPHSNPNRGCFYKCGEGCEDTDWVERCCHHDNEATCQGTTGSPRCDPVNGYDQLTVVVNNLPASSDWGACESDGFRRRTLSSCSGGVITETQACACNSSTVADNWVTPAVGASPTNAPAIPVKTISPSYNTGSASVTWATTWLAGANSPLNAVSCASGSTCNPTLSAKDTSNYGSDTLNVTTTPVSANACSSQPACVVQRPFAPTNGSVSVVGSNATFAWDTDKLVASYQFDTDSQALPIATYDFENASNRYLDTSGNGLTGVASGTPAFVAGSTAGKTAIQFVKTSNNALTVTNSLLKLNDYKYSFLFKLNSGYDSSWHQIFTIKSSGAAYPTERQPGVWFMPGSSSGNRNCFQITQDNGTANPDYINCAGPLGVNNSSFAVGTWYLFEVSRQGTTLSYSVDGVQRYTTNTFSATMRSVTLPILYIGDSNPSGYASPDIAIDEFKIYSLAGIKDSSGSNTHLARRGSTLTDSSFVAGATGYGNAFRMTSGSAGGASLSNSLFKLNNYKYSFLFKLNAGYDSNWRQIFTVKAPSASYPHERQPGLWMLPSGDVGGTTYNKNCFQITQDNGTGTDFINCVGPTALNTSFVVDTWYRLEVSRQGSLLTYSVKNPDGTGGYTGTATFSAAMPSVSTPTLYIGNSTPNGYAPPAITIDDFKLWNTDNTLGKFGCVRDSICTACSYDYKVEWRGASESYTDVKSSGWLVASPWDSERVSFTTSSSSICGTIYWRVRRGTGYSGVENWSSEFGPFDTGISCPVTATINFSGDTTRHVKVFAPGTSIGFTRTANVSGSSLASLTTSGGLLNGSGFTDFSDFSDTQICSGATCSPVTYSRTISTAGNYYVKVDASTSAPVLTCNGSPFCNNFLTGPVTCDAGGANCASCSTSYNCDATKHDYVTAIVCPGNGGCGSPTTSGVVLGAATKSGQVLGASKVLGTSTEKGQVLGAATTNCTSGNNCDRVTDTQVATLKLPANIPWPSPYSACMDGKAKLQVSTDSNFVTAVFETPLYSRSVVSNTLTYLSQSIVGDLSNNYQFPLTYTGLIPVSDTTYYWRVVRYMNTSDADYDGEASGTRSFVVVPNVTISGSIFTNSTGTCPATSGTALTDTVTVNIGGVFNSFSSGNYSLSIPWSDVAQDVTVSGNGYSLATCTVTPDSTKTLNLGVELNTSPWVQVSNGDIYATSYGVTIPTGQSLLTAAIPSPNACGVAISGGENVGQLGRVVASCTDRHVEDLSLTSSNPANYLSKLATSCGSSGCNLTVNGETVATVKSTDGSDVVGDVKNIYVSGSVVTFTNTLTLTFGGLMTAGAVNLGTGPIKIVVNPAIYLADLSTLPAVGISHTSWKELN